MHLQFLFFQPSSYFSWDTHSKQSFRLDEEGFLWLSFCSLVIDLILSIFVGPFMHWLSYLHAFCTSCIYLYALFLSVDLTLLVLFLSVFKNSKTHKNWKISKKFDRLYCVYYMWVWRSTFVLMALCIYEFNLFCKHISLCEGNLENYVWLL